MINHTYHTTTCFLGQTFIHTASIPTLKQKIIKDFSRITLGQQTLIHHFSQRHFYHIFLG